MDARVRRLAERPLAVALLFALLGLCAYGNALPNAFQFDDFHTVVNNVWLRDLSHLLRYFTQVETSTTLAENQAYRPLLTTSFAFSYALGGNRAWAFRLGNLLLHLGSAWLLWFIARRLGLGALTAVLAGLLFLLHPLNTQVVNYIHARSSGQATAFYLLGLALYLLGLEADNRRRAWGLMSLAVLSYGLGLFTKASAATLPALCFLAALFVHPERWRRAAAASLVMLTPLLLNLAVRASLTPGRLTGYPSDVTRWDYLATQFRALTLYLRLFVWPVGLNADRGGFGFSRSFAEAGVLLGMGLIAVYLAAAWALRRRERAASFGLLWFLLALLPTTSVITLAMPAMDHRTYVGVGGLCIAGAAALAWIPLRLRGLPVVAVSVVLTLGAGTVLRNRVWRSDLTLWRDVVAKSPNNGRAHMNYGLALAARKRVEEARKAYDDCARLWPNYAYCYINRANLALYEGRWKDAKPDLERARSLAPQLVHTHYYWGRYLEEGEGDLVAATAAYRRTLERNPHHVDAKRRLEKLEGELRAQPGAAPSTERLFLRAFAMQRGGDHAGAVALYEALLEAAPKHEKARHNLGFALLQLNQPARARDIYAALHADLPQKAAYTYNLAHAHKALGARSEARTWFEKTLALDPSYPGAKQNLEGLLKKQPTEGPR